MWHGSVTLPTGLAQRCALKRLKGELATHPLYQHRLMRELEIGLAVTRDHPNLVTTQTCEVIAGRPSIVMELVVGSDLSSIDARLDFDMVRYLAAEVLSALEYLAAKGVVHRDLSPANILIDHQGAVRVGDFGLATWVEGDSWRDDVVGTEPYQAPEARAGGRFGCEADLYALGRILWELLTDDIDSPSLPRDTPKDLRDVVNGLLAPQPRERWTATRALARLARCDRARVAAQLGRMARGEVLTTTRARPRKGAPADVDDTRRSISAPDRDGASARYRAVARLGWLAAAVVMFVLGSVVGANYLAPAQSQVQDAPVSVETTSNPSRRALPLSSEPLPSIPSPPRTLEVQSGPESAGVGDTIAEASARKDSPEDATRQSEILDRSPQPATSTTPTTEVPTKLANRPEITPEKLDNKRSTAEIDRPDQTSLAATGDLSSGLNRLGQILADERFLMLVEPRGLTGEIAILLVEQSKKGAVLQIIPEGLQPPVRATVVDRAGNCTGTYSVGTTDAQLVLLRMHPANECRVRVIFEFEHDGQMHRQATPEEITI